MSNKKLLRRRDRDADHQRRPALAVAAGAGRGLGDPGALGSDGGDQPDCDRAGVRADRGFGPGAVHLYRVDLGRPVRLADLRNPAGLGQLGGDRPDQPLGDRGRAGHGDAQHAAPGAADLITP